MNQLDMNIENLLQTASWFEAHDELTDRKRLHAARLNSMHLRQPKGSKQLMQLAFEEIERVVPYAVKTDTALARLFAATRLAFCQSAVVEKA